MAIAVLLVLAPVAVAALVALGHRVTQQRRALERLERRMATLELEHAPTLVIEPDPSTPPRPPNALLN